MRPALSRRSGGAGTQEGLGAGLGAGLAVVGPLEGQGQVGQVEREGTRVEMALGVERRPDQGGHGECRVGPEIGFVRQVGPANSSKGKVSIGRLSVP